MEITDVIHLHIGCEVLIEVNGFGKLISVNKEDNYSCRLKLKSGQYGSSKLQYVKPLLVPLVEVAPEHEKELKFSIIQREMLFKNKRIPMLMPFQIVIALKHGYDIFNLIPSGKAVNKNTI